MIHSRNICLRSKSDKTKWPTNPRIPCRIGSSISSRRVTRARCSSRSGTIRTASRRGSGTSGARCTNGWRRGGRSGRMMWPGCGRTSSGLKPDDTRRGSSDNLLEKMDLRSMFYDVRDGNKVFRVSFDVSQFAPDEISVKTQDQKLIVHAKHEEKGEFKLAV